MRWMIAALVLALTVPARADQAADLAEAERLAAEALLAINDDHNPRLAIDNYQRAYALSQRSEYLLYAGIAARQSELPNEAVVTYRRYLEAHRATTAPELVARIEGEIESIIKTSATLVIATSGLPAEVIIDKRSAGIASKAAPLVVLVRTTQDLELVVHREGYADLTRRVPRLAGGARQELVLEPAVIRTTAELRFTSTPAGAIVRAGTYATVTPGVVTVAPGAYSFVAHKDGYDDVMRPVQVDAGKDLAIDLVLTETPSFVARHKVALGIGAAVTVIVIGVILAPTIADAFGPDNHVITLD